MRAWVWPFICLAAAGFVASVTVHVAALFGVSIFGGSAWALHMGIFVVWLPAILASKTLTRDVPQKDFWRAALRGCPPWMRTLVYATFAYAFVNFLLFFGQTAGMGKGNVPDTVEFRGFSGHWMAFYAAAVAMLTSYLHSAEQAAQRRCVNGHPVPPLARYCGECGMPVVDTDVR